MQVARGPIFPFLAPWPTPGSQILPLGTCRPGRDARLPGGLRVALAAQRENPVGVTSAEALSPNHPVV